MSLLHPQRIELGVDVPLANMPPADIVAANRAVEAYGETVQQDFWLASSAAEEAQRDTQALLRGIIRRSLSSPSAAEVDAVTLDPNKTLDSKEVALIDERINNQELTESLTLASDEVAFMARCLLRQQVRAADEVQRKEAKLTLDWLSENPATQQVVERATRPSIDLARVQYAGKLAMNMLVPRAASRPRLAR